jgi:predicted O-methyltransferase YrrM
MEHNYQKIDGWFNMEDQYLELLSNVEDNGIFVELGAWKGKSTSFIVTEIIKSNKKVSFFTIDTFEGETNGTDYNENKTYSSYNLSEIYQIFLENTEQIKEYFQAIRGKSCESASKFEDESIDVIFIDAGHSYESVKMDILKWYPKMKKNSIMAGHDYTNNWPGVKKAVDEFFGSPDKVENLCWFKYIKKTI